MRELRGFVAENIELASWRCQQSSEFVYLLTIRLKIRLHSFVSRLSRVPPTLSSQYQSNVYLLLSVCVRVRCNWTAAVVSACVAIMSTAAAAVSSPAAAPSVPMSDSAAAAATSPPPAVDQTATSAPPAAPSAQSPSPALPSTTAAASPPPAAAPPAAPSPAPSTTAASDDDVAAITEDVAEEDLVDVKEDSPAAKKGRRGGRGTSATPTVTAAPADALERLNELLRKTEQFSKFVVADKKGKKRYIHTRRCGAR